MIGVKITGVDAIKKMLRQKMETAKDLQPIHAHIGNLILNSIEESFEKEASPFGQKWQPVKIRTIHQSYGKKTHGKRGKQTKAFLRHASNKKILTQSSRLRTSFTVNADAHGVVVGTNLVYAAIHQFGSKSEHKSNIPARPFLPVSSSGELERGVQSDIMSYLVKKLG